MPATAEPFVVMSKPSGPICNLDCRYCYYLGKTSLFPAGEHFRMTDTVLEAFVRSFIEASPGPVVHFVWHGGEPALRGLDFYRRALALQERYLPTGWTCINNLQTNGVLLDDAWCAFLAEHRFHVGVSIDGPARLHDACRTDKAGHPTHAQVMRALTRLQRHGIHADVLCTLNAVTAPHPAEVYRFFIDHGVRWLQFLPVVQRTAAGGVSDLSVTPEAMGTFLCTVFDEWIRNDVERIAVQIFVECFRVCLGESASLCVMAETCGRALAMEHDGSVYSCDHFVEPAHRLGDVVADGLAALVDTHAQVAFGRAKRDALPRACRACPVLSFCNGGCPKDRFAATVDGEPGLNYLCTGYRRFFEHAAPYLRRMVELTRLHRPAAAIMAEVREEAADSGQAWRRAPRNAPCPCGSGRKYKHCCLATRDPR
ncbi:MAG: anaerobic sulfatase maturase [Chloroflexota bacterium]|nr:anaerobic sulfatase maturase [Chloroflexota bacterium]